MLRYAKEPRVEAGLRELITDAEDRLDALEARPPARPLRSAGRRRAQDICPEPPP